jgi:hypothetical protein
MRVSRHAQGSIPLSPCIFRVPSIDPDIIAIARLFIKRHGDYAAARVRAIVEEHEGDESEDADSWAKVAEMVEALLFGQRGGA